MNKNLISSFRDIQIPHESVLEIYDIIDVSPLCDSVHNYYKEMMFNFVRLVQSN